MMLQHRRPASRVGVLAVSALALAMACTPSGSATISPGPTAAGTASPGPAATAWPTLTIEASIALGAAHADFTTMTDDLATAVDSEDPARIVAALDAAVEFLSGNQKNIPRLQDYDATKTVGDRLAPAYAKMIEGATQARDGLTSGDAAAVHDGFAAFSGGSALYVAIASDLAVIAERALFMKRVYLK